MSYYFPETMYIDDGALSRLANIVYIFYYRIYLYLLYYQLCFRLHISVYFHLIILEYIEIIYSISGPESSK